MPLLALALVSSFVVIVYPLRAVRRRKLFGSAGRVDYSRPRPASWWLADGLFAIGFALVIAGPALQVVHANDALFGAPAAIESLAVGSLVLSVALAVWAQETMGAAWRPDIAPAEACHVVTGGPFRAVRNPNYVAMLTAAAGTFALAPSAYGIGGWLALWVGLVLTVRAEEPQLCEAYGAEYRRYAARVGRFLPLLGRLRDTA